MARNSREPLPDADASAEPMDIPVKPAPGTEADVTMKFRTRVNPGAVAPGTNRARAWHDDGGDDDVDPLIEQAAIDLEPPDAFAQFCEAFSEYVNRANVEIVRLPDPGDKKRPGNTYRKTNFTEYERLGNVPFDPTSLLSSIQFINGDSGGVFRLWLIDVNGAMIPGARLDRIALADPPTNIGAGNAGFAATPAALSANYGQPAPVERHLSEEETEIKELRRKLISTALERLLNPTQPTASDPLAGLSAEDRVAMMLVQRGDVLGHAFTKVTSMLQATNPEDTAERMTWKEKAMDRLFELATNNPTLAEKVNDTVALIVNRLFAGPAARPQVIYVERPAPAPQRQPRPAPAPAQPAPQAGNLPPEAPDADRDDPDFDDDEPYSEVDEDMSLIEDLTAFLGGDEPINANAPIWQQLQRDYPRRFRYYIGLITNAPSTDFIVRALINFTVAQDTQLYKNLLTGPAGPHFHARIEELRQFCLSLKQSQHNATQEQPAAADSDGESVATQNVSETSEAVPPPPLS